MLAQRAIGFLSKELKTEVALQKVSIGFFDKVNLEGLLIKDRQHDTILYAGKLKVRLVDWFFIKNKIELTYVGLEDAVIKQQRDSSAIWRDAFIGDYFSSGTKDTTPSKPIAFDLKKVDFKNIRYYKRDGWRGEDQLVKMGSLLLNANKIDLVKSVFDIEDIILDKPYFSITNYDGLRPDSLRPKKPLIDTGMYFNAGDIRLTVKHVTLNNGSFVNDWLNGRAPYPYFDGAHILVQKLNGTFDNVTFIKDTIRAKVNITAKERSGFQLKKLAANFRLTPQVMEFANLDLQSSETRLTNYYAMRFNDFNEDFAEFIDSVFIDARFRGSTVSSNDVAYFAPELKSWNKKYAITGKFKGTITDFTVKDIVLQNSTGSYVSGDLAMKGLPDIDNTIITLSNGIVSTNYNEAAIMIPMLKKVTTPNLSALGNIRYVGDFNGTLNNFTARGTITSNLGGVYTDIAMNLPAKGLPTYRGKITTSSFNLGKFVNVATIGRVNFSGDIVGKSFDLNTLQTKLNGAFSSFEFNGYNYQDLVFNGEARKQNFTGTFKADDPNFNFTSNFSIDFSGDRPKVNLLGDLVNSNFKKLNFTNEAIELTGLFDLNFEGKNIDDFLGAAKILNATLYHDSVQLNFDSLTLAVALDSIQQKQLRLSSNEFDLAIDGQYNMLDLPNSFQAFLNRYYPSYIAAPTVVPKNQNFTVSLLTRSFDGYANAIDSRLRGLEHASIVGSINTADTGSFYLNADIPSVRFEHYEIQDAKIVGTGQFDELNVRGDIGRIYVSDSAYLPGTELTIKSKNDHSELHLKTSANAVLNDAELNADIYTFGDGVRVNFRPSSFILNDKVWNLEKQGEIVIRKNLASATNVKFSQGFQEISIESDEDEGATTNNLIVKLKDVNIGDFTPIFITSPTIEGVANGEVKMSDFLGKFRAEATLHAEEFRLDNDSVGIVDIKANYDAKKGLVDYKLKSNNERYRLNIDGAYDLKDSVSSPLNNKLELNGASVAILNNFLGILFSDISGLAYGTLYINGKPDAIDLLGDVALRKGGLTVKYTQVHYTIDSANINFEDGAINFNTIVLKDALNNSGTVTGKLYQRGLANFKYDFDVATSNMLLLDTKPKDNSMFYGRAIGKARLTFKGPENDMRLGLEAEVTDTSAVAIRTNTTDQGSDVDYIVFKQYGTEIKSDNNLRNQLSVDLDLRANNKAQVSVILDDLTGDVIDAVGEGRLQIKIPAKGSMTMNGRYNIDGGRYAFNFQSFIRKPFDLKANAGNYIEWKGNPYDATLKVDAVYTAEKVSMTDLLGNNNQFKLNSSIASYRGDVYVVAHISDKLSKPKIDFSLEFPKATGFEYDDTFQRFLARLKSDENEMLKQVTWLIVFNSFSSYGDVMSGGGGTSIRFGSLGVNTISQKLTNEVNKIVSNALYKLTGDRSLQFDLSANTYSSSTLYGGAAAAANNRLDRQQVNFKINKSILDGKIIVAVGGDFDFGFNNSAQLATGNFQWLPDISVQVVLSKDRRLRAVVFNKSTLDVNSGAIGRRNRQGISLSYTRDFDRKPFGKDETNVQPAPQNNLPQGTLPADTTQPVTTTALPIQKNRKRK